MFRVSTDISNLAHDVCARCRFGVITMEIELKYRLNDASEAEAIFSDARIFAMTDPGSEKTIKMHAAYFDTEDASLSSKGIVFRVREEGDKLMATLKWDGVSIDGLHSREEINVPLSDRGHFDNPNICVFSESDIYEKLESAVLGKELVLMMEMNFVRRAVRLDTGTGIFELSVDNGNISCRGKTKQINELEIELFSGSNDELKELGEYISNKFKISPENHSKFKQGLDLVDKNRV